MQVINSELSVREQITEWLRYYGVSQYVEIEQEVENIILKELSSGEVSKVYIDAEGGLNIESGPDE